MVTEAEVMKALEPAEKVVKQRLLKEMITKKLGKEDMHRAASFGVELNVFDDEPHNAQMKLLELMLYWQIQTALHMVWR